MLSSLFFYNSLIFFPCGGGFNNSWTVGSFGAVSSRMRGSSLTSFLVFFSACDLVVIPIYKTFTSSVLIVIRLSASAVQFSFPGEYSTVKL